LSAFLSSDHTLPEGTLRVDAAGRCLDWRGTMLLGDGDDSVRLLLENKRRIRQLSSERRELLQQLEQDEALVQRGRRELEQAQQAQQDNHMTCQQLQLRLQQQQNQQRSGRQELERMQQRRQRLEDERNKWQKQRGELEQLVCSAAAEVEQLQQQCSRLQEELCQASERYRQLQQCQQQCHAALTTIKVESATARERCKALERQRQQQQESIARQSAHAEKVAARLEQLCNRHHDQQRQQDDLQARIQTLTSRREEEQQQLSRQAEALSVLRQQVHDSEEHLTARRAALARLREEKGQLQVSVHQLQLECDNLRQQVRENYNVDLASACPDAVDDVAAAEKKVQRLRQRLDNFGEVNLMAIDEHAAVEQRRAFLVAQRDDLLASIADLHAAIDRINRTTRKRFKTAFEQVNGKFREVFARLFVGGSAELVLTDADNLLETGVEIIARPPGKKLQHIGLLSGGEKALTAVALVFAVFLIKPSPFCILDEVDAPLDDANIGRFNEMVTEMASASQFIIITHNVRTMEIADTMFGVTMQEPGVSTLVAVQMGDVLNDERLRTS